MIPTTNKMSIVNYCVASRAVKNCPDCPSILKLVLKENDMPVNDELINDIVTEIEMIEADRMEEDIVIVKNQINDVFRRHGIQLQKLTDIKGAENVARAKMLNDTLEKVVDIIMFVLIIMYERQYAKSQCSWYKLTQGSNIATLIVFLGFLSGLFYRS